MLNDKCWRVAESALGLREGREHLQVVMVGIGELFMEEMALKGHTEKGEARMCVSHMSGCVPLFCCSHDPRELDKRKIAASLTEELLFG